MKRTAKLFFVLTVLFLFLVSPLTASAETLRIGWQPCTSNWYPFFVGMDKGFYEKAGIEVKQQVFMSGIPEAEALAAGELDVAFMGSTPGLIVGSTGLPITLGSARLEACHRWQKGV